MWGQSWGNQGGGKGGGQWGKGGQKQQTQTWGNQGAQAGGKSWGNQAQSNQQWGAQKRPASAPPAGAAAKVAKVNKVVVTSKNPAEKMKLATILGDYVLQGENHGQSYFKKNTPVPGRPGVFSFLYYWDARDGANMAGWWFGDKVGGNEVWAHCPVKGTVAPGTNAPASGWKTPWDGPVNPNLTLVSMGAGTPAAATNNGKPAAPTPAAGKGATPAAGKGAKPAAPNPQEAIDEKKLEEIMKKANVLIKGIETQCTSAENLAKPLSDEKADAAKLDEAVKKVEAQATKAQEAIQTAQKEIATMRNDIQKFAPQAKQKAFTQFNELQNKIRAAQTKLNPLKNAKAEVEKRKAFQATLDEITTKFKTIEAEISNIEKEAKKANASSEMDEIKSVEESVNALQKEHLLAVQKQIDVGMRTAPVASKATVTKKKEELTKVQERMKAVRTLIKEPLDKINAEKATSTLDEKIKAMDEAFQQMEDAEMPFMTGIEDLPAGEHEEAVAACEKAGAALAKAVNEARSLIQAEMRKCESYAEKLKTPLKEALTEAKTKVETASTKLNTFKTYTAERKVKGLVRDILVKVVAAEAEVKKGEEKVGPLKIEKLDDADESKVNASCEAVTAIEKEGQKELTEGKKLFQQKQRQAGGNQTLVAELKKVSDRINKVESGLAGLKKATGSAIGVVKGKQTCDEMEMKVSAAEETVAALESKVGDDLGDSQAQALIDALGVANSAVNEVNKLVNSKQYITKQGSSAVQAAFKELVDKFVGKVKAMREKIDTSKKSTKSSRERLLSKQAAEKAQSLVKDGEAAVEAVTSAEDPFLRGIEVIPLDEATGACNAIKEAEKKVNDVMAESRSWSGKIMGELNSFDKETAKTALEEVAKVKKTMEAMNKKMADCKRDMADRGKLMAIQKVEITVKEVEDDLEKAKKTCEPLASNALSGDKAGAAVDEFDALKRSVNSKMEDAKRQLNVPRQQAQGSTLRTDLIKKLTDRLGEVQKAVTELRTSIKDQIETWLATKAVRDAAEAETKATEGIKICKEVAKDLIDKKGDSTFAYTVLKVVLDVLKEHMTKSEIDEAALFKKASGGKGKCSKAAFEKFLKGLPDLCEWFKLLELPEEQVLSVTPLVFVKAKDIDEDGFKSIFRTKQVLLQKVSLTAGADLKDEEQKKEVKALEVGAVLDVIEEIKSEDGTQRLKCKTADGDIGFVTRGAKGIWNMKIHNAAESAAKDMKDTLQKHKLEIDSGFRRTQSKIQEAIRQKEGKLFDKKEELETKAKAIEALGKEFSEVEKNVNVAKGELAKRQDTLLRNARESKSTVEASKVLGDAIDKAKAAEAQAGEVEDLAKPVTSLAQDEFEKAEDPAGTLDKVEKKAATAREAITEARKTLKEQAAAVDKDGPVAAVKSETGRLERNLQVAQSKIGSAVGGCRRVCATLTRSKLAAVESAVRTAAKVKGGSGEDFFKELAGSGEGIPEAKFSKYLSTLKDLTLSANHKKLVFKEMLTEGALPKQRFLRLVQQFYRCVKDIGITPDFDIGAKTIRKVIVGEMLEGLEEAKKHEESGTMRIKAKALQDGQVGWISLTGNAGTAFLAECPKPYLYCNADMPMYKGELSEGVEVKSLKSQEILEVIEGPVPEKGGDMIRMQCKCKSDNKTGFLIVKDATGAILAEKDTKYKCKQTIALTDSMDVMKSKVIRKIEQGELVAKIEGPVDSSGAQRIRAKADKDGAEGWITITGNAGTTYVEETPSKVYTVKKKQPLTSNLEGGIAHREVAVDEVVEMIGDLKTEKADGMTRLKCKALSDGKIGWVMQRPKSGNLNVWTPQYKSIRDQQVTKNAKPAEGEDVRKLDKGEGLEFISGPVFDDEHGARAKMSCVKDKVVGWVTIQDGKGVRFLTGGK